MKMIKKTKTNLKDSLWLLQRIKLKEMSVATMRVLSWNQKRILIVIHVIEVVLVAEAVIDIIIDIITIVIFD